MSATYYNMKQLLAHLDPSLVVYRLSKIISFQFTIILQCEKQLIHFLWQYANTYFDFNA